MMIDPHPIFKDFKHVRISVDSWLTCSPGMGGNFLLASLGGNHQHLDDINEYLITEKWLGWGWQNLPPHLLPPLDDLYNNIRNSLEADVWKDGHHIIGHSHFLPWLAHDIFDITVDELTWISMQSQDAWIVRALGRAKMMLNSHYQSKPWLMEALLENMRYNGEVLYYEFEMLCENIAEAMGTRIHFNTVAAWRWYLRCKADKRDFRDIRGFQDEILHDIFEGFYHLQNPQIWREHSQYTPMARSAFEAWHTLCNESYLDKLSTAVPCIHRLDYREFFFELRMPSDGMLNRVSAANMARYSEHNLTMLHWTAMLLPAEYKAAVQNEIGTYRRDLAIAAARL